MDGVKSGIFLPSFWDNYGSRGIAQAMREVAAAADALGFDSLWASDHIVASEEDPERARCIEPIVLMGMLAQQFPHMIVGTDVLVLPQRNAVLVAKQAATLSVLSGGRFILGIGAGWNRDEFRMLGADFDHRGKHTDEAIHLMRTLWRQTPVSFEGDFYHLENAYFYPDPAGDGPPVWIGGFSGPAVSRAARLGDGWMPFWGSWREFALDLEKFRKKAARLRGTGRAIQIAANVPLRIISGSDEHATDAPQSVEQIVETLLAYRAAGLETVLWNIQSNDLDDYIQQMRLVSEKIVPAIHNID